MQNYIPIYRRGDPNVLLQDYVDVGEHEKLVCVGLLFGKNDGTNILAYSFSRDVTRVQKPHHGKTCFT